MKQKQKCPLDMQERNIKHTVITETLWWQKHTLMMETHCDERNTLWLQKHTAITETHCDNGNSMWWWKLILMAETHCNDGNTLWRRKHTVMAESHIYTNILVFISIDTNILYLGSMPGTKWAGLNAICSTSLK